MNTLLVLTVLAGLVATSYALECGLNDCTKAYNAATKAKCDAVADWRTCVYSQTTEADGLCNVVAITGAKGLVKAAELAHGCSNGATMFSISMATVLLSVLASYLKFPF